MPVNSVRPFVWLLLSFDAALFSSAWTEPAHADMSRPPQMARAIGIISRKGTYQDDSIWDTV